MSNEIMAAKIVTPVLAKTKFVLSLAKYKESHTSWTIWTLKLIELILCSVCVSYHLEAVLYVEEPMPHNILFCSAFGGFFILSLSGVLVPASGQVTPPGVDMVFCICAFVMFYIAACVAMYYVTTDPHLQVDSFTDEQEFNHNFFQHCRKHCIISFVTGTFYLMHAVFSADRLVTVKKGLSEDVETEADYSTHTAGEIPVVDITEDTPITLHLFILDWMISLYNRECCQWCKKKLGPYCCKKRKETIVIPENVRRRSSQKKVKLSPHQVAALKHKMVHENLTAVSTVTSKTKK